MEDCIKCGQTVENCECHIPDEVKHAGLYKLAKDITKHKSIDEQVSILKDTLEEMMTGFDSDEDRMDFILDICNGYKKRLER